MNKLDKQIAKSIVNASEDMLKVISDETKTQATKDLLCECIVDMSIVQQLTIMSQGYNNRFKQGGVVLENNDKEEVILSSGGQKNIIFNMLEK